MNISFCLIFVCLLLDLFPFYNIDLFVYTSCINNLVKHSFQITFKEKARVRYVNNPTKHNPNLHSWQKDQGN